MKINLKSESLALRPNANTCHDDGAEMYSCYGAHITTEKAGDICIQSVDYEWLDDDDDANVVAKLLESTTGLDEDEAFTLVEMARRIRTDMDGIESMLDEAVEAYETGDLEATIEALRNCSSNESEHGDNPSTSALIEQLLMEQKDDSE